MELGLKGRVAMITGGTRGIGRAVAMAFAREGAHVAITYNSDRGRAERVAEELRSPGGDVLSARLELGDHESIQSAVTSILDRWECIDVLVNNAVDWGERGPFEMPPFEHIDPSYWRPLLQANLDGHFAVMQAVLPSMRARSWGRIVNVSSTIANDGMAGVPHYAAAKAGLHGLTRTLAKEVGAAGILVNVVMPGLTLTERNLERMPDATREHYGQAAPIGRLLTPEEIARPIVFLGSAANCSITGAVVRASGGRA
jgi:3-oxoacyl-[acyl-carrier protein] reductase